MKKLIASLLALYSALALSTTTVPIQLLNTAGSTAGQAVVSTGPTSAAAWGGVPVGGLAAIAANTVIGNATGSSAIPTAITVTGCNGAAQAMQWTNGTGFGCNSAIATSGANSNITGLNGLTSPVSLPGVTNGACALAGNVGECKSSNVPIGSPVSLTSGTAANVTSVSLTAGNWLCYGNVGFIPNGSTVTTNQQAYISTTSAAAATSPNSGALTVYPSAGVTGAAGTTVWPAGILMVNVTTTAPVFLEAFATFSTSTETAYGYINCIRWH